MTSNPAPVAFSFDVTNEDLVLGRLNRPGRVRPDEVYALAQALAVRTFGRVRPEVIEHIRSTLQVVTNP
jgi:hypothetical protein